MRLLTLERMKMVSIFEDIDYSNCDLKGAVEEQIVLPQSAHMYVKSNPKVREDLSNWCVDDLEVILD